MSFQGYITTGTQDTNFTATATFAGSVMTVTGSPGSTLSVGQTITGASVAPGTTISSLGTGSGGAGTYNMSTSNALSSAITISAHTYAPALTVTSMNTVAITSGLVERR